jgi:hypothetical protein
MPRLHPHRHAFFSRQPLRPGREACVRRLHIGGSTLIRWTFFRGLFFCPLVFYWLVFYPLVFYRLAFY